MFDRKQSWCDQPSSVHHDAAIIHVGAASILDVDVVGGTLSHIPTKKRGKWATVVGTFTYPSAVFVSICMQAGDQPVSLQVVAPNGLIFCIDCAQVTVIDPKVHQSFFPQNFFSTIHVSASNHELFMPHTFAAPAS